VDEPADDRGGFALDERPDRLRRPLDLMAKGKVRDQVGYGLNAEPGEQPGALWADAPDELNRARQEARRRDYGMISFLPTGILLGSLICRRLAS